VSCGSKSSATSKRRDWRSGHTQSFRRRAGKEVGVSKILIPSRGAEDWQRLLAEPEKHWRSGYSAKALAALPDEATCLHAQVFEVLGLEVPVDASSSSGRSSPRPQPRPRPRPGRKSRPKLSAHRAVGQHPTCAAHDRCLGSSRHLVEIEERGRVFPRGSARRSEDRRWFAKCLQIPPRCPSETIAESTPGQATREARLREFAT
jgi:hypothetical protein